MFLHSCNTNSLDDVDTGTLLEFGGIQKRVERGKWVIPPTAWVELPAQKGNRQRKPESTGGSGHTIKRKEERNRDM